MSGSISETEWRVLLQRIKQGNCTPFLGAGACYGALPLGATLSREWAKEFNFPLDGADDLAKVSQYVALLYDQAFPKEEVGRLFEALRSHRPGGTSGSATATPAATRSRTSGSCARSRRRSTSRIAARTTSARRS
jgi:hypothetical protein